MGETKAYVCNRFPTMSIRNAVQFQNGLFETADPALQKLVESNDLWGVHIHPRDLPEGTAVTEAAPPDQSGPQPPNESPPDGPIEFEHGGVVIGMRGTKKRGV